MNPLRSFLALALFATVLAALSVVLYRRKRASDACLLGAYLVTFLAIVLWEVAT